jgi:hypothetical protein
MTEPAGFRVERVMGIEPTWRFCRADLLEMAYSWAI